MKLLKGILVLAVIGGVGYAGYSAYKFRTLKKKLGAL